MPDVKLPDVAPGAVRIAACRATHGTRTTVDVNRMGVGAAVCIAPPVGRFGYDVPIAAIIGSQDLG